MNEINIKQRFPILKKMIKLNLNKKRAVFFFLNLTPTENYVKEDLLASQTESMFVFVPHLYVSDLQIPKRSEALHSVNMPNLHGDDSHCEHQLFMASPVMTAYEKRSQYKNKLVEETKVFQTWT